jgi:hypothetical protein
MIVVISTPEDKAKWISYISDAILEYSKKVSKDNGTESTLWTPDPNVLRKTLKSRHSGRSITRRKATLTGDNCEKCTKAFSKFRAKQMCLNW